eukprot:CAMPEP_0169215870 /NCGR_PEP_ID=MMETSP1016-20121227/18087_1 /TAXON_ID=342587 /ORGANISM="Karlodinium micrum, Strain CCMP2283" /LENGTH=275 /DNA_ID=CAMNT_0009293723 /DNA_START=377 /DNA_END=1206 /DNA_ORIENTATION=-
MAPRWHRARSDSGGGGDYNGTFGIGSTPNKGGALHFASLGDDTDLPKDNADGDIPDGAATRDAIDGGAITEHGLLACITDCTGGRGGATNAKGADTLPPGDIGASGACKLPPGDNGQLLLPGAATGACKLPPGDNGQLLLPGAATGACKLPPGDIGQAGSLLPPETTTGAVKLPPGDNGAARSIGGGLMERGLPDTITGGLGGVGSAAPSVAQDLSAAWAKQNPPQVEGAKTELGQRSAVPPTMLQVHKYSWLWRPLPPAPAVDLQWAKSQDQQA